MFLQKISLVIPVYNSEAVVEDCLHALVNQQVDNRNYEDYEIIFIDDGSIDATSQKIKDYIIKYKFIKYFLQPHKGPAAARNKGAKEAKGEIILFTDSDCQPQEDWIKEMTKPFESNKEIIGVKGAYKTKQKSLIARFVQLEYEDKYDRMKKYKYIDFIDTYSAAFRKDVFLKEGGYDESFPVACAEDVDLSYRLAKKGYKMVFNPNAIVFHRHPETLKDYLKKKYKFAYWRVLSVKKTRRKVFKDTHTPQVMKVQAGLAFLILFFLFGGLFFKRLISYLMLLVALYVITAVPFIIKALKKDKVVGLISFFFLFLRSVAQMLGLIKGSFDILLRQKYRTDAQEV